ncbi:MAG: XRE family transcriptional regulator [Sulfurimonas sp.]|jgi:hypothetical protein
MDRQEFNEALKKAKLSKKVFAELVGAEYGTVNNWGTEGRGVPYWVSSWIENYLKREAFDTIAQRVDEVRGL